MKSKTIVLVMGMVVAWAAFGVLVENASFRLELGEDACARSLVVKSSGRELLMPGVRIPFATLTQNRAYDNEYKLMYPAKPWVIPSDRLTQEGDLLKVRFAQEFFTLRVRVRTTPDYIAFVPEGVDYEIAAFGDKRPTEIDSLEFLRLPVADKCRFGKCANVSWDDHEAVAVMALEPATRVESDQPEGTRGWRRFAAGTEASIGLWGHGAALVATSSSSFLDRVDALERDFGLPRGVRLRRDPLQTSGYWFMQGVSPANLDEHVAWMRKGGFKLGVVSYTAFAKTCGHFDWKATYPNGLADLKRVTDAFRAAGIVPGIHIHYCKVSTNDLYVCGGRPDPRLATVSQVVLSKSATATDTELFVEGNPQTLRTEEGRRLVLFGDEFVSYASVATERPYRLLGVRRGVYGSHPQPHAAHEYGRQVDVDDWPYFIRIDQDTDLPDEIAARLAEIIDGAGFEFVYFDGAEDVPQPFWYNVPRAQMRVWNRLKRKPRAMEGALKSHFGWHLLNRGNAFDSFLPERTRAAAEKYILPCAAEAADDFSAVNFGWIGLRYPGQRVDGSGGFLADNTSGITRGTQPGDLRYLREKAEEFRCPLSVKGNLGVLRRHPAADALMEALRPVSAVTGQTTFVTGVGKERKFAIIRTNLPKEKRP